MVPAIVFPRNRLDGLLWSTEQQHAVMAVVLGIESSCDETAAAVVVDGVWILAERVASQAEDFSDWGGVVPELAARGHVDALPGLPLAILADAGIDLVDLDAIAVTARPGLIGSLHCGVTCAKMLALAGGVDLVDVDHITAHIAAIHLEAAPPPTYPLVALVASGGHSHYYHCVEPGEAKFLGGTVDDAAGEAFDKAASILGLGYPGGPAVDALAETGHPGAMNLPRSFIRDTSIHLSFAGLKTNLLYRVRGPQGRDPLSLSPAAVQDACASFQAAVVDCLVAKLMLAADQQACTHVAVGGGVACNRGLRRRLVEECDRRGWQLSMPAPHHCTDNGAMVAVAGWQAWTRGRRAGMDLCAEPTGSRG